MFSLRSFRHMALWMGAMALAVPGAQAQTGALSLDTDYTGHASLNYAGSGLVFSYGAYGENASAPSGLTSVRLSSEVFYDFWGGQDAIYQRNPSESFLGFTALGAHQMQASFQGQGSIHLFEGTFTVNGGTGPFTGSTGGGTFSLLKTGSFTGGTFNRFPATISIRGTATPAAIPEPGSLALLGLAGVPLLCRRGRRYVNTREPGGG